MKNPIVSVAPALALPDDLITLTIAILGNRGSGKTNTGVIVTEDLLALGHQVVIVDPLDVWWGLKSSRDGKAAGYPVIVLGGAHGDVPLADTDGRVIADFVVESRLPVILSLRHVSKKGQRRFMADFAEHVYKRKGEAGRGQAHAPDRAPTSEDLQGRILQHVTRPQGAILRVLIAAYPDAVSREALALDAEASPTSSAYTNNLGALRSLGLIDYPAPGQVAALPVLFID